MSEPPEPPIHSSKAARNERIKMLASSLNTIGLAILGLGFFTPIFAGQITALLAFRMVASAVIFVVLHFVARQFLRALVD